MVIYGTRSKQIARETVFDKCPNCGNINQTDIVITQSYAHVFWIPFFPLRKRGHSECAHCRKYFSIKEMPEAMKLSYMNLKNQARTPAWTFTGAGLLLVLIAFIVYQDNAKDRRVAAYLSSPKAGDVWEIKTFTGQYSLSKIEQVTKDSIYIRMSQFETNRISGLRELKNKGEEGYEPIAEGFSVTEINQWNKEGKIINIHR